GARSAVPAVGPCLQAALQARWKAYREQLRSCQADVSEEAVHELRVATRRLIAQLALLSCMIPSPALDKARRMLKRRLAALGELRDTHVQRTFVSKASRRFPELADLRERLGRQEKRLVRAAAGKVGRCKMRKLERWLRAVADELDTLRRQARGRNQLAAAALGATTSAFAEAVARRRAIDPADPRTIHRTRVAFKRFRYMVESLSPCLTGLSKRELRALAWYQRRMGIIQDLEVLHQCVARYLERQKDAEVLLRPFVRHLQKRRARALRAFLKTADALLGFWPPTRLESKV
ncbi:MAG TPA: CHAD domain-containing protein, partial [Candidatus Acidoferrum sp.]|nr:CHAD domain-containing protein [Candidatus Acidoferrum sp.]